jgi:hypothetical protein
MQFNCPEEIKPRVRAAGKAALATQGKRKGFLLSRMPVSNSDAGLFWRAAVMTWNPYKASVAGLLFLRPEEKEFLIYCERYCEALKVQGVCLDYDRHRLSSLGVW